MMPLPPYAQRFGITLDALGLPGTPPVLHMPPADDLLGRPGFLHGGALAGLLEMAAILAAQGAGDDVAVKPIGMTIAYLRGARFVTTFARGVLIRNGARIAAVAAHAWQDDETRPVATARLNLSVTR